MSNPTIILTDDATILIKWGVLPGRTKIKITELMTDPVKHVALAYLDEEQVTQLVTALSAAPPVDVAGAVEAELDDIADDLENVPASTASGDIVIGGAIVRMRNIAALLRGAATTTGDGGQ